MKKISRYSEVPDNAIHAVGAQTNIVLARTGTSLGGQSRSDVQELAKSFGLPATGATQAIARLVRVVQTPQQCWTLDDFRLIAPHLSLHQDVRPQSASRVESIMRDGLTKGMVDSLGNMNNREWTWGRQLLGGDAYVFVTSKLTFKSKGNPYLAPGNKPLFHFPNLHGQDIFLAITSTRTEADEKHKEVGGEVGHPSPKASMGMRVVAVNPETQLLTFSDPEYMDGEEYVSGETLAEFGVENITDEERATIVGLEAACAVLESTAAPTPIKNSNSDLLSRPLAAPGLTSYRCKGPYGWIMIGARDDADAIGEAKRSSKQVKSEDLQVWNGAEYVPSDLAKSVKVALSTDGLSPY